MVRIGDKVIFSTNLDPMPPIQPPTFFEEGQTYIVTMVDRNDFTYKVRTVDDEYGYSFWNRGSDWFDQIWFKSLSQVRKEKLKQIEDRG